MTTDESVKSGTTGCRQSWSPAHWNGQGVGMRSPTVSCLAVSVPFQPTNQCISNLHPCIQIHLNVYIQFEKLHLRACVLNTLFKGGCGPD